MRRSRPSSDTQIQTTPGDRLLGDDRGSAALEFIVVGLLLLVPVVYLIVTLGVIQGQTLGVETGARHVARSVASAPDLATADERAEAILAAVVEEYGLDPEAVDISFDCLPAGSTCPEAGATVVVSIATHVRLPLVPPIFGLDRLATVPVEASAAQKVSRLWGSE